MKVAFDRPTLRDLARAADELQGPGAIGDARLAVCTQWARFDPRFAQIVVDYLARQWRTVAFGAFADALDQQPWPRAASVLFDFAALASDDPKLRVLSDALSLLHAPASAPELYFVPTQWVNAVVLRHELEFTAEIYARSGYVGSQSLLSRARWPADRTHLSPRARLAILRRLLDAEGEVTVARYRTACRELVSSRQAQRDLARYARPKGFTRGRRYGAR